MKKYLPIRETRKKEDLRKIYILKCLHETKYGNDVYVSLHHSREDAMNNVAKAMKKSDYDADSGNEHFYYECEETVIDVSLLQKADV